MPIAEAFLAELFHEATSTTDGKAIGKAMDAFLPRWPSGMDLDVLAQKLVEVVVHREQNLMALSSSLGRGTDEQRDVASRIDEILLKHVLDKLPYGGNAQPNWLRVGNRDELLRHLARTITRKSNATNFVLDRLNPAVERYVQAMEFQRAGTDLTYTGLQIVACLISLGLEVTMAANAPDHHREGMAADYVHWSGRLMRSEAAQTRFEHAGALDEFWRDDVAFCARQITAAYASLGPKVAAATACVLADAMVLPVFKDMLIAAPTTD